MTSRPTGPIPQGRYVPARRYGDLIFTAGMTPRRNGELVCAGKISENVPLETYREAVELAAQNALQAARSALDVAERLSTILNMTVFVNSTEGFKRHSALADFASLLIEQQMGSGSIPSRTAIGATSLPDNAVVEIAVVAISSRK